MSDQETAEQERAELPEATVWIMVDHSEREPAYEAVAAFMREDGVNVRVVTATEAIGTMAKTAITSNAERLLRGVRVAIGGRNDEDLIGAVRRDRPDMLVVTSPRFVRALSVLENLTGTAALQVGVIPDYNYHDVWSRSSLHGFVVPHADLAAEVERSGVNPNHILVAGPAVSPGFARDVDRDAEREAFGFKDDETIMLVRAEPFDLYTMEKVVFQLRLVEGKTRFVFHHNGDGGMANALRRTSSQHGLHAIMFGHVDDLERYVAAADAVLVAPHDPMLADIVAQGRPTLIVGDDEGWQGQVGFLTRNGMSEHVADVLRLGAVAEQFLGAEPLAKRTEQANAIGLPGGSREVAEALKDALRHADRWREVVSPRRDAPRDDDSKDDAPRGPFESIGDRARRDAPRDDRRDAPRDDRRDAPRDDRRDAPRDDRREDEPNEFAGISRAEAKEQLAQLILQERDLERRLGELEREQQRWRNRLDLAREWGERDLEEEAEGILREYLNDAEPLRRELDHIKRQKLKLRMAANGGKGGSSSSSDRSGGSSAGSSRAADVERRFRSMESERDLDSLRDRIRREMGED